MTSKLEVRLGEPEHGWIRLTIRTGDAEFEDHVSNVPSNSLEDLVRALANLADGDASVSVSWMLEPARCDLEFQRTGDTVRLDVVLHRGAATIASRSERLFSVSGTFAEMCLPFWRALRALRGRVSPEELRRRWGHEFPERELDQLTTRIKG